MDIELARTFLEVVSTGSFIRAAERLNVGQTTVSARVRILDPCWRAISPLRAIVRAVVAACAP